MGSAINSPSEAGAFLGGTLSQWATHSGRATLSHYRSMPGPSPSQAPHTGPSVLRSARSEADIAQEPKPSLSRSQRLLVERVAMAIRDLENQMNDFCREMEEILTQMCEGFTLRADQLVEACHREYKAFPKQDVFFSFMQGACFDEQPLETSLRRPARTAKSVLGGSEQA
ncbi:hypothetical protein K470DRAFT_263546 [Piedraia hortae CBS 480.64]|uniref:Uncharacterized protein n=1 Tax=Piedraia hortae CBS 480.64 TaxID=1314780 RepID=A0A6A7C311_9PEZI|nr:hypothetical protein K470DRAFT_263546 [Piedraia hortae CBS 480.64]